VRIGLATECVEPEQLMPAAMKLAEELAERPQTTLRIIKQGLRRGMNGTLESEWEFNVQAQAILLNSPDFQEAVKAIGEKRKPKFG
jgi:enoyl-CoA hydratase/carnithine racemase